jgi:hypothetical protein
MVDRGLERGVIYRMPDETPEVLTYQPGIESWVHDLSVGAGQFAVSLRYPQKGVNQGTPESKPPELPVPEKKSNQAALFLALCASFYVVLSLFRKLVAGFRRTPEPSPSPETPEFGDQLVVLSGLLLFWSGDQVLREGNLGAPDLEVLGQGFSSILRSLTAVSVGIHSEWRRWFREAPLSGRKTRRICCILQPSSEFELPGGPGIQA